MKSRCRSVSNSTRRWSAPGEIIFVKKSSNFNLGVLHLPRIWIEWKLQWGLRPSKWQLSTKMLNYWENFNLRDVLPTLSLAVKETLSPKIGHLRGRARRPAQPALSLATVSAVSEHLNPFIQMKFGSQIMREPPWNHVMSIIFKNEYLQDFSKTSEAMYSCP